MRISFMILPESLHKIYQKKYQTFSQGVSKLEQLSLALYLKEGLFYRHTKKLYNTYKKKNEIFQESIQDFVDDDSISLEGTDSNLHAVINFKERKTMDQFVRNCLSRNYKYTAIEGQKSIIFPYSGIQDQEMGDTIKALFKKDNHI